jgi:hypothetical protein
VKFFDFNEDPLKKNKDPTKVLQIGPVNKTREKVFFYTYYTNLKKKSFDYYIVGTIGNTLNSHTNTGSDVFANTMINNSNNHFIIDTKRGLGAPQFNIDTISKVLTNLCLIKEHPKLCVKDLLNHIMNIGFRNTVGRTLAPYGKNLVAKPNGANYKTVENQWDMYTSEKKLDSELQETKEDIRTTVENYFKILNHKPTPNEYKGYYFILDKLQRLYSILPMIYVSGSPGEWNPAWNILFYGGTLKEYDEVLNLGESLQTFKNKVINYSFPLTPAYDCVGLYAFLLGETREKQFNQETQNTWALKGIPSNFNQEGNNQILKEIISYIS